MKDSLGIEIVKGNTFILHQVEAQETLYGLSKRYFCNIEVIKKQNQIDGNSLSLGSIIKIPWGKPVIHQVTAGQTLYTLSKLYGVAIEDLRTWNDLTGNELEVNSHLQIGNIPLVTPKPGSAQNRHIVSATETLYSIAKQYQISINDLQSWNGLDDFNVSIGDSLKVSNGPVSHEAVRDHEGSKSASDVLLVANIPVIDTVASLPEKPARPTSGPVKAIKESGIAAVFEEDDTKKYLALHRSAPVGTIMQVRNEMTNLTVFVRVVGKLPNTGVNNKVLLRLSKSAQRGLGALDNRFRVELSYIPSP